MEFNLGDDCPNCHKPICNKISDYESYLECHVWCHCNDSMYKSTPADCVTNVSTFTVSVIDTSGPTVKQSYPNEPETHFG